MVEKFYSSLLQGDTSSIIPPEILIEAYFDSSASGDLQGVNNFFEDDSSGLQLRVCPDEALLPELLSVCAQDKHDFHSLPVEY